MDCGPTETYLNDTFDVAIVGYGPVGMCLAALLARAGRRVVVLERYAGLYNLPRAATFDDETMRTFAQLGIADELLPKLRVQTRYEWLDARGEILIEHEFAEVGASGWAEWHMMYQPDLEDALDRTCRSTGRVDVRFESRVTAFEQDGDGVVVLCGEASVRARYVVGCDGGNSFTREWLGLEQDDLGFSEPWMVCDFELTRPVSIPMARQVCDPRQPQSIISIGPRHHRFSFMLDAESAFEVERDPARVWKRVEPYLVPGDAELIRVATYTFRSLLTRAWRKARILLAGDAAHQMPPFLGQGMCSGIRDAQNIAFKLDLLLAGAADESLLDTYQSERFPHVLALVQQGVELGRVQTLRDPALAARRDETLRQRRAENQVPAKFRFPPLGPGLVGEGGGALFPQGRVAHAGRVGRFGEVVGYGWFWILRERSTENLPFGRTVVLSTRADDASDVVHDLDGTYGAWLDARAAQAVLVRPDFYVYGVAKSATELALLRDALRSQLSAIPLRIAADA